MSQEKIFRLPELQYGTISCAYVGKPNKCMCGCSGKYFYTKVNQVWSGEDRGYAITDDEVDDAKVQRAINKMKKNASLGIEVLDGFIYTLIVGRTQYTIYLRRDFK